jgi:hypothetical protein
MRPAPGSFAPARNHAQPTAHLVRATPHALLPAHPPCRSTPAHPLQDINVSLTGINKEEVTAATLSVTIYYRGWPVQRQSRDICSSERPVTPACPFE